MDVPGTRWAGLDESVLGFSMHMHVSPFKSHPFPRPSLLYLFKRHLIKLSRAAMRYLLMSGGSWGEEQPSSKSHFMFPTSMEITRWQPTPHLWAPCTQEPVRVSTPVGKDVSGYLIHAGLLNSTLNLEAKNLDTYNELR